jgi:hypothetical protein
MERISLGLRIQALGNGPTYRRAKSKSTPAVTQVVKAFSNVHGNGKRFLQGVFGIVLERRS